MDSNRINTHQKKDEPVRLLFVTPNNMYREY